MGRQANFETTYRSHSSSALALPVLASVLCYLIAIEVAVEGWYRWHERSLVPATPWTVRWPNDIRGLREVPIDEHTRDMLRSDEARQVCWPLSAIGEDFSAESHFPTTALSAVAYLYFFRWEPGTATVLRARAHRPDICLPATGWRQVGAATSRAYVVSNDFVLPFQHFRFTRDNAGVRSIFADTFFCLREDRVRPEEFRASGTTATPFSDWSVRDRVRAVRDGLRNPGQQVLEYALVSGQRRSSEEAEAEFAQLVPKVVTTNAETLKH